MTSRPIWVALALVLLTSRAFADDDEGPPLSVYGFARLDVLVDDRPMSDLSRPVYVPMGSTGSEMTMTPRLSQIGLSVDRWQLSSHVEGEGKLEIDFGGGAGVNAIRLRHAYGAITLRDHVEVLAGQTWDLISPLMPSVQNDTLLLGAGNTGDRRPQVRLTTYDRHWRAAVAGAVTGTFDGAMETMMPATPTTSSASTKPMLQWLVEARGRERGDRTARIGVWGHVAREDGLDGKTRSSTSFGGHALMPLAKLGVLHGELYTGYNAADIGGGLGLGTSPITHRGVHSIGGWGELAILVPKPSFTIALGGAADVARGSDLGSEDRQSNVVAYTGLRITPVSSIRLGLEYLLWRTTYKDLGTAVANRVDFSTTVSF